MVPIPIPINVIPIKYFFLFADCLRLISRMFYKKFYQSFFKVLLYVNYFAADKGKSLVCKVFIEAEIILPACMQSSNLNLRIFSNYFYTVLP